MATCWERVELLTLLCFVTFQIGVPGQVWYLIVLISSVLLQSKKEDKDQESIQSSTTPATGYQWEGDNVSIIAFLTL